MTVQSLDEKYRFRARIVTALVEDLVGPADGEHEYLAEAPLDRYIVGALWPQPYDRQEEAEVATTFASEPTGAEADSELDADGNPVAQALTRFPSSMGITFSVRVKAGFVDVAPNAARYEQSVDNSGAAGDWRRIPLDRASLRRRVSITEPTVERHLIAEGLELYILVRPAREEIVTVTAALRNVHDSVRGHLRDSISWFQPSLEIVTGRPHIVDRTKVRNIGHDADLDSAALLYRHAYSFATGHGCAAEWDLEQVEDGAVTSVRTTFIPTHDVHRAKPGLLSESVDLRMATLAEQEIAELGNNLRGLTAQYRFWIEEVEGNIESGTADVPDHLRAVSAKHLEEMRTAARRIDAGIRLLEVDPDALRAFRLANRAMQLQRARQDWIRGGHIEGELTDGSESSWRPFQIAYILLNLPGIANPDAPDRDIADLLWFPTGGGKTEAYLGLVAFVILLRRIRDDKATGVAVIMRYTLRLLTIQQFERASMLLCALETVRLMNPDLGQRAFSIGLWVGSGATPNKLSEARSSLKKLMLGDELQEKNPVQLTQCPWCGLGLTYENYSVLKAPIEHLRISCGNVSCDFRDGLPVHVIDEDVYRARPELLLGTVDKFAMMAWNEEVGKLFARDKGTPPELIIQDELHLISGPLGSMVGLYETAVDAACTVTLSDIGNRGPRPKVIASTATIRRAEQQVRKVFNRNVALFPPPGIDPDQSFFARPSDRKELGTRQYVGVMSAGTSHATLMVRVYSVLLQAAAEPEHDDTRDPYWTLLGYFNSLRVLGSAYLQVEADVRERLKLVAARSGKNPRELRVVNELTSRVPSSEIPGRLKQLEQRLGEVGTPNDVVLATNMISVGVDIDRLGLMVVMGQPQASAEYIQATSRVGRQHPGVVVTIFNSARSRDRSHYENFVPFHQALYRAVEATSATPFAARARDRGLHGILIAMARLLIPELAPNEAAHLASSFRSELGLVKQLIEQRAHRVSPSEANATEQELSRLLATWFSAGEEREYMKYFNKNLEASLMVRPEDALTHDDIDYSLTQPPWPTQQSLRDVDAESNLYQIPTRKKSR